MSLPSKPSAKPLQVPADVLLWKPTLPPLPPPLPKFLPLALQTPPPPLPTSPPPMDTEDYLDKLFDWDNFVGVPSSSSPCLALTRQTNQPEDYAKTLQITAAFLKSMDTTSTKPSDKSL